MSVRVRRLCGLEHAALRVPRQRGEPCLHAFEPRDGDFDDTCRVRGVTWIAAVGRIVLAHALKLLPLCREAHRGERAHGRWATPNIA